MSTPSQRRRRIELSLVVAFPIIVTLLLLWWWLG